MPCASPSQAASAYNRCRAAGRSSWEALLSLLLPLFPLDVVLFPGASLPLHIFEPRYQEMIGECLAEKKRFGVVREREKGWVRGRNCRRHPSV